MTEHTSTTDPLASINDSNHQKRSDVPNAHPSAHLDNEQPRTASGDQPEVVEVVEIIVIEVCEFRQHHPHHPHCHHHKHLVDITIDGKSIRVHAGEITVTKLKELGGVPKAFELDQMVDGTLVALPDDGQVKVKECERFIGVPKDGKSS